MVDSYDNCPDCEHYRQLVDYHGDKIDPITLQSMVEVQEHHLRLAHGKGKDGRY